MRNLLLVLIACSTMAVGCTPQQKSALAGAAIGAGAGAAIGGTRGKAGKGAAIGAAVGGLGGAIASNQKNRPPSQGARYLPNRQAAAPPQSRSLVASSASRPQRSTGAWGFLETMDNMEKRFPSSGHSISKERADEILEALQPQRGPVDGSYITGMPFGNFW